MGIAEDFATQFHKEHRIHARYLEGLLPLKLGSCGRMGNGVYEELSPYPWVLERFSKRSSPKKADLHLTVGKVRLTSAHAGAEVAVDPPIVLGNAGLRVDFARRFSALLILKGARIERVQNIEGLEKELLRRSGLPKDHPDYFDPSLRIVTEVTRADAYWLYTARDQAHSMVLEASAEVPHFDLANLDAGFTVRGESSALGTIQGEASTPLFRLTGLSRAFPLLAYRPGFLSSGFLSSGSPAAAAPRGVTPTSAGVRPNAIEQSGDLESLFAATGAESFDHLYVASDLHISARGPLQAYTDDVSMGWLGQHLAARAETARVCWVIAGDIVDFLARPAAKDYFNPELAKTELDGIAEANRETFGAWRTFSRAKNATLVFLLGNHDLELAMPEVWARFCKLVGIPEVTRRLVGEDFRCRVDGKRVTVKHGNEADEWNKVDYERLRQFAAGGGRWQGWKPNEGTALVIDHMNDVKEQYPFVDLLKPEEETVETFLLALLRPGTVFSNIGAAWSAVKVRAGKVASGRVGGEEAVPRSSAAPGTPTQGDALLEAALLDLKAGVEPLDMLGGQGDLSNAAYVHSRAQGMSQEASVYLAVYEQIRDRSFDVYSRDKWFDWFDKHYPEHTDVLIVGHTHLAKLIQRTQDTVYVNSGTWMPLIDLPEVLRLGQNRFDQLFASIEGRSIETLESAGFIRRRRSVVHVGGGLTELCEVHRAATPRRGRVTPSDAATLALVPIAEATTHDSGSEA